MKCKICNKRYKNCLLLSRHIKSHNLSSKEYYDIYLKKENEGICYICKKETNFISFTKGYRKYCSHKCSANSEIIREKTRKTNLEKYGHECIFKNKEIYNKIKNTNLRKYGVDNPFKSNEIKRKIKQTNIKKYGVENPFQSKYIKNKIKITNLKKYGVENPNQSNKIKEKSKQTNIIRYGYEHPNKSLLIKNKIYKSKISNVISKLTENFKLLNLKLLDDIYINCYMKHKWKCLKCGYEFYQIWNRIQQGYNCPKCFPRNKSKYEYEISDFLNNIKINFILNNRNILKNIELDFYLNDKNIAIELNGLYWHSELFKDKYYHLRKTELCESKNIRLIHIFEDEWIYKQDIVKSRLKQILGINNSKRIHARKCTIKEISLKIKNEFLNKYHIQGEDKSVIKLGAFYNDELISVMTFFHGNISKGFKYKDIYKLSRFCYNINYYIPGIASKLLTYFKKNYEWKEIISYADRRWSEGNLYYKLGFELDSVIEPEFWYVKGSKRINRFSLKNKPGKSKDILRYFEWETREGFYKIWDCGYLKFKIAKD